MPEEFFSSSKLEMAVERLVNGERKLRTIGMASAKEGLLMTKANKADRAVGKA